METIITILLWVALVPVSGVLLAIGIDVWTDNITYLANKIRWYRAVPLPKKHESVQVHAKPVRVSVNTAVKKE